jgi:hypothetical protein
MLGALGVALTAGCGGGDDASSVATPRPRAPATPRAQPPDAVALRLFEAAALHASLATAPLAYTVASDNEIWPSGPCAASSGSLQASLDGASVGPGTFLPTGSHTLDVTFAGCLIDGLIGQTLNGTASVAYTGTSSADLTAQASANSIRGTLLAYHSDLHDVAAHGSGTLTRTQLGMVYAPAVGSMLVNNQTRNVATFGGGSYSYTYNALPVQVPGTTQTSTLLTEFNDLAVAINGTPYVLNGSLNFPGLSWGSGEVRITSNGALIARIYGDGGPRTEVLSPLAPF